MLKPTPPVNTTPLSYAVSARDMNDDPLLPVHGMKGLCIHARVTPTSWFSLWGVLRYPDGVHLAQAMGMCSRRGKRRYNLQIP